MSSIHGFWAFEEDFLEDGTIGVCTCGWKSSTQINPNKAIERLMAKHAWEDHAHAPAEDREDVEDSNGLRT